MKKRVQGNLKRDAMRTGSMNTREQRITIRCIKLLDLPPVVTDWQEKTWRPDCDHYDCGVCTNPTRRYGASTCPLDGTALPMSEVEREVSSSPAGKSLDGVLSDVRVSQTRGTALDESLAQAVKDRIVNRTGGRLQALAIEITGRKLILRGSAPCYYVKQLALQELLDALSPGPRTTIEYSFQVIVRSPGRKGSSSSNRQVP
jgi:hypothetical protein